MAWFKDGREELIEKPYVELEKIVVEYESMLSRLKGVDIAIHRSVDGIGRLFGRVTERRKYLTSKQILEQIENLPTPL